MEPNDTRDGPEMTPPLLQRSSTPTLQLMNHTRRVLDSGLAILVWIAVIIYFMEFRRP